MRHYKKKVIVTTVWRLDVVNKVRHSDGMNWNDTYIVSTIAGWVGTLYDVLLLVVHYTGNMIQ